MNKKICVLIVDDEERFRETTATILKKRGFNVKAVGSGIEAIEETKRDPADVVILDVQMPGMDGNEALGEIKKIKPDIAVIMLTGHGTPESAAKGLSDGIFDYLAKPCDIDVLAQKITEAFSSKGGLSSKEAKVKDIMIPLSAFSTIRDDRTVAHAIAVIHESFTQTMVSSTIKETVHRSILVMDGDYNVIGIITFTDLLQGLQPQYMQLLIEKPTMADSIVIESPEFSGMFTIMARDLAKRTVREIMCDDSPPTIDANACLMEAANRLLNRDLRRLLVVEDGKTIGVIREQDLFFTMATIIRQHDISDEIQ
jgi:CheY-like chemotaxis protein/signal-transduction protein with cAMP-binding, CBS, and nucleotidyltransferase domain